MAGVLALAAVIAYRNVRTARAVLHPARQALKPLGDATLPARTDVTLRTRDGLSLRGWYVPSRNRAAVVVMHGFAENRTQMLFEAEALSRAGYGVLLFDSRGHGESDGDLVTWGDREREDLRAAVDFLSARSDVEPSRLGVLGFSMGGTTALLEALDDARLKAVAAAGAYPSLVADTRYSYGKWGPLSVQPVLWTMRLSGVDVDAVDPMARLCELKGRPLLLINGDVDEYAPAFLQDAMFQAACEPKSYWVVKGAHHGGYAKQAPEEYARRLRDFFDAALLGGS
ncbi:alpha/beta fold hydrolase [Corallococcus praedator]|uniref:Alpha/beta fold hydrolase n=1 Tax=Corallococcus praedator TaxID=2316724 RepID=A0ABX9QAR3_9BACT|nr:alpha/beta fold hydrolase [Corallococcus sp. CA047B]RKH22987.1 alpha/beta fold hydrolase [Corallococcus sp. CA031C]RKH97276.1 alpha/beta fold hydrolase [Corallococcus praedator]